MRLMSNKRKAGKKTVDVVVLISLAYYSQLTQIGQCI